jgi:hypothetical protein
MARKEWKLFHSQNQTGTSQATQPKKEYAPGFGGFLEFKKSKWRELKESGRTQQMKNYDIQKYIGQQWSLLTESERQKWTHYRQQLDLHQS